MVEDGDVYVPVGRDGVEIDKAQLKEERKGEARKQISSVTLSFLLF
jgi:hypothetical protein